jgi:hypothetical protein
MINFKRDTGLFERDFKKRNQIDREFGGFK